MRHYLVVFFLLCLCASAPAAPLPFLCGADLSALTTEETSGAVYRNNGRITDILAILRAHGGNCVRLRLFVRPNGERGVVNDLPYTLALARRVKAAHLLLMLDIHYSDTWADPGKQFIPAAWQNLSFPELAAEVQRYTAETIRAFRDAHCLPDYVQVGNEITNGMLWPAARFGTTTEPQDIVFDRLCALLNAGFRGVRAGEGSSHTVKIILHTDTGANAEKTRWFFSNVTRRHVPFDIIGLSYYPWWHGTLAQLQDNLKQTARLFHKPIAVVETQYPAAPSAQAAGRKNMAWLLSPAGQAQFLSDVVRSVRAAPNNLGCGVLYWNPESYLSSPASAGGSWGNSLSLFNTNGSARPAWDAFAPMFNPQHSAGITPL